MVRDVDDEWREFVGQKRGVEVAGGPLTSYTTEGGCIFRGPLSTEVDRAVARRTPPFVLLELTPTGEQCEV